MTEVAAPNTPDASDFVFPERHISFPAPTVIRQLNKGVQDQPAYQMKIWSKDPILFLYDAFDLTLFPWQEEFLVEGYMRHQRNALIASKGPGKTFIIAGAGWHFFLTKHNPKMAALSVTEANLKANLWAELHMLRARSRLAEFSTKATNDRISIHGKEQHVFIDARSYPKNADEAGQKSALAGIHAPNVCFLLDEGGTIPDGVFTTADAALSTGDSEEFNRCAKLIVAANPEVPSGVLYRASIGQVNQKWYLQKISGDPKDPKRAPMVSISWAQEQIDTFGRDDPSVMINVLALYPKKSSEFLLSDAEIFESMQRQYKDEEVANAQLRVGLDVARGGADHSALAMRRGLKAYPIEQYSSLLNGPELAAKCVLLADEKRVERVYVDDTGGYGSSVIDSLQMSPHIDTTAIKYNAQASDSTRYFNKRTEMWVRLRDWVRKGGQLPNDPDLARQLVMPKVFYRGTQMRLEEKEEIKKRLGKSPDKADALAQTFADPEQPSYYADYQNGNALPAPGHPHQQQGNHQAEEPDIPYYMREQSQSGTKHQS